MRSLLLRHYRSIVVILLLAGTWLGVWLDHPFFKIWPTLVALGSVIITRNTLLGLSLGTLSGALFLADGNLFLVPEVVLVEHLIPSLQSSWNLSVILFTLLMGGFVGLLEYGGGIQAILQNFFLRFKNKQKGVQWSAFGLGFLCFFDGLANSMLVGRVMQPVANRFKVSRERLAYIVDTTSSPLACLAFISTWIAYQLSMIREGFLQAGMEVNPYEFFLRAWPFQFYCIISLILLAVVIAKNIQWGFPNSREEPGNSVEEWADTADGNGTWHKAVGPLVVLWLVIFGGLIWDGAHAIEAKGDFSVWNAIGAADTAKVLVLSSAFACLVAWLWNRGPDVHHASQAFSRGAQRLIAPVLILLSAWCLGSTLKELGTADFIAGLLQGKLVLWMLPAAVFILGALISFSTGTSWGTMGIMFPLMIPIIMSLGGNQDVGLLSVCLGAMFSGAVFGDHCSPMSDTTIVSSFASGCEPLDHVKTQLPYALLACVISLIAYLIYGLMFIH